MIASLLRLLPLALPIALASCHGAPAAREVRRVAIDNRSGEALWLCTVARDGFGERTALPAARTFALSLPPGRYALQLGERGPRVALPLPPAELGYEPPALTALTVWPWPAPEADWCWIPPGPALCGDDLGVGQEDERPVTTPTLPGYWLARCETSNAQYAAFLAATGRAGVDPGWLDLGGPQCRIRWDDAAQTFTTDAPDLPVVKVSWAGAVAYCRWLTATTGVTHRLPSEREWEKAARGAGSRAFAYGDTCTANAANQASGRLRPCGSYAPSEFGLCDLTGNVFEWTGDPYGDGGWRALRGGSFVLDGVFIRNAMRMRLRPEVLADDTGFRVLRENADTRFGPSHDEDSR